MICFPNTKINIGLNIISKRNDGYHNIETVFYPIPFNDILEILPSNKFELKNEGIKIDCPIEKNLCYKAYKEISDNYKIEPVKIVLYKNVPFGTGLGSGSSDAAHTLILLNKIFNLNINNEILMSHASNIGADCSFFIKNSPVIARGIGNEFTEINLCLKNKYLVLCLPEVSINTVSAYKSCSPKVPDISISKLIELPISEWRNNIKNDFEDIMFNQHPILAKIKLELYNNGAVYAQMSGSGSSIFGVFETIPNNLELDTCRKYKLIKLI